MATHRGGKCSGPGTYRPIRSAMRRPLGLIVPLLGNLCGASRRPADRDRRPARHAADVGPLLRRRRQRARRDRRGRRPHDDRRPRGRRANRDRRRRLRAHGRAARRARALDARRAGRPERPDLGDRRGDAPCRRGGDDALRAAAVHRAEARSRACSRSKRRSGSRSSPSASLGALVPSVVPGVPAPRSAPRIVLFAVGLALYGALAVRAMNTFLLTRRAADFAVVLGIVLLACALYGALILTIHGSRLVARPHLRDARHPRRRRVARLRPPPRPPVARTRRRPARCRARRGRGGVPRCARPRADGAARREGHARRRSTHAASRCSPSRSASSSASPRAPAQPRDRRPAARHRQALGSGGDPAEARLARRRRVRGRSSCIPSAAASCSTSSAASTRASRGSCSTITSGSTAAATRAASKAASSTSRPGSSPSATCTTRSSRRASTAPAWPQEDALALLRDESTSRSTPAASTRWSVQLPWSHRTWCLHLRGADGRVRHRCSSGSRNLLEEIELADQVGLDVFGVGEHHRPDFAVSSPAVVLAAAAERTTADPADERSDAC